MADETSGSAGGEGASTEASGGGGQTTETTTERPQLTPEQEVAELRIALEKTNRDAARHRARNKELEPLAAEAERVRESTKTELERAVDRAAQAEQRASKALERGLKSELRALATGTFADPEDAILNIGDLSALTKDDELDRAAAETALKAVLERKPHLGKATNTGSTRLDLGPRGATGAPKTDMTSLIRQAALGQS